MKQLILISLVFFSYVKASCQVFGNIIERTIQPTVSIKIGNGSGSGILVKDSSSICLITAKHVIFDASTNFQKLNSNHLLIQFYSNNFEDDSANYISLDLIRLSKTKHILVDSLFDISLIKIAEIEESGAVRYLAGANRFGHSTKYNPYYIEKNSILRKSDLFLGEDVFIVGFPTSIGLKKTPQFNYEKPLLKRGAIASLDDNFSSFIIDCSVFHGNSGGPVFLERKSFDKYSLRLIGIVTEYIPLINSTVSNKDLTIQNSNYAVIVPIELSLNLLYKLR